MLMKGCQMAYKRYFSDRGKYVWVWNPETSRALWYLPDGQYFSPSVWGLETVLTTTLMPEIPPPDWADLPEGL